MRSLLIVLLALASGTALAAPSLTTPPSAAAGSTITLKAAGTGNPREFVTVVPKGTREGAYQGYVYVTGTGDLKLAMPATPGDYELRLCAADSPYKTLVAKPIQLIGASASVSAPASVAAGAPGPLARTTRADASWGNSTALSLRAAVPRWPRRARVRTRCASRLPLPLIAPPCGVSGSTSGRAMASHLPGGHDASATPATRGGG